MTETERGADRRAVNVRGRHFGIDKSINIGNIVSAVALLITLINYGSQAITYLKDINNKVSVLWIQFALDHPDKAKDFDSVFGKH